MLRKFCVWLLNTYFGKYVENLNADQLSYAILKGEVELENLPLKRDAFRSLNLPIRIRKGFIGKIKIQLGGKQYVLQVDDVCLVAEPFQFEDELDIGREAAYMQEIKMAALDVLENGWKSELVIEMSKGDFNDRVIRERCKVIHFSSQRVSEPKDSANICKILGHLDPVSNNTVFNYFSATVTNILENLQLKINNVHIRYEDQIDGLNQFVCDITAQKLQVQSCDSKWTPGFVDLSQSECSYKLVELENLAVSCDRDPVMDVTEFNTIKNSKELRDLLQSSTKRMFLILPVSAEAHIKRNCSPKPLESHQTARIVCDIILEKIQCQLTDLQYCEISKSMARLENINRIRRFLCHRPICSIMENPKAWWVYLMKCFSMQTATKSNFRIWLMKNYIRDNIRYIRLYMRILQKNGSISLTKEEKDFKEYLEWDRDYDQLRVLREISMRKVIDSQPPKLSYFDDEIDSSMSLSDYLSYLFPSYWWKKSKNPETGSNSPKSDTSTDLETSILEQDLEKKLIESFASNTNEDFTDSLFKQDCILWQLNFSMKSAVLCLCNVDDIHEDYRCTKLELNFEDLQLKLESSPQNESLLCKLRLAAVFLNDYLTENSQFPLLIEPISNNIEQLPDSALLLLFYEISPNDNKLQIESQSLKIVYSPTILDWLFEFFFKPIQKTRIEHMKNRTKQELYNQMESILRGNNLDPFNFGSINSKTRWKFKFDIAAPQVYFVDDLVLADSTILNLDFGRIRMTNCIKETWFRWNEFEDCDVIDNGDDDDFKTPTSTPVPFTSKSQRATEFDENWFCNKLYEKFRIEFTDLQVLVGTISDSWQQAQNNGTSKMHILDRFNIIIELEKRQWPTDEKNRYPSLVINSNLPILTAHLDESKIIALQLFLDRIINISSTVSSFDHGNDDVLDSNTFQFDKSFIVESRSNRDAPDDELYLVQFSVDYMTVSMESNNRALAELQVNKVLIDFSHKANETVIGLSVHDILLVDALQPYGPDYCLLLSSNDFIGSELAKKPQSIDDKVDDEALIDIEAILIGPITVENIRSINVRFNSVDCVTNKETIKELIALFRNFNSKRDSKKRNRTYSASYDILKNIEFEFDFNRLRILLIRPINDVMQVRQVALIILSEAKIHTVFNDGWTIDGSLASVQIIDKTKDNLDVINVHKKVLSVGLNKGSDKVAFRFKIQKDAGHVYGIEIDLATVFYTYVPEFLVELQLFFENFVHVTESIREVASGLIVYDKPEVTSKSNPIRIKFIKVLIDSPVVIIPRSWKSAEIFVINLGKISITSDCESANGCDNEEQYHVEIRKMNLYSLRIKMVEKNQFTTSLFDYNYDKVNENFTIIDDTVISFTINRNLIDNRWTIVAHMNQFKISLIRSQYEQFLDTVQLFNKHFTMLSQRFISGSKQLNSTPSRHDFELSFKLDNLLIELKDEIYHEKDPRTVSIQKLINLVFNDLLITYNEITDNLQSREIRFSLQSFKIEDLPKNCSDPNRFMVRTQSKVSPNYNLLRKSYSYPMLDKKPVDFRFNNFDYSYKKPNENSTIVNGADNNNDNTVCQIVILIDKSTGRQDVRINFHKLDVIIDAQSWAFLLHFFSVFETRLSSTSQTEDSTLPTTTDIKVNSLTVKLINRDYDLAHSQVEKISININCGYDMKEVVGEFGSILVKDLTPYGQLYRNRFTTDNHVRALRFKYCRKIQENVSNLIMEANPLIYMHTNRFVSELQVFFINFRKLRDIIEKIRCRRAKRKAKTSGCNKMISEPNSQFYIDIVLVGPTILVPVHSTSSDNLLINLDSIIIKNSYQEIVVALNDNKGLVNVIDIDLREIDLFVAKVELLEKEIVNLDEFSLKLGDSLIARKICSLLPEKFNFGLKVETNLSNQNSADVANSRIIGSLSKIDITLNEFRYQMLRGILMYNFGEDLSSIFGKNRDVIRTGPSVHNRLKYFTLNLDLTNVVLRFVNDSDTLSSISFIRSYLVIDTFNDGSQDIDLVSDEILVDDIRCNNTGNVFRQIVKPIKPTPITEDSFIQLEIHSRRKHDTNILTIIVKDVQIYAIYSWWSSFLDFLLQKDNYLANAESIEGNNDDGRGTSTDRSMNLVYKVNFINSEVILVENESNLNSTAIFLKTTALIKCQPNSTKLINCELQQCEMFSCILSNPEESALSIIDPLSVSIDLLKNGTCELRFSSLNIRLSYNDVQIFARILTSFGNNFKSSTVEILNEDIEHLLNIIKCKGWHCRRSLNNFKDQFDYFTKAVDWLNKRVVPHSENGQFYDEVRANVYTASEKNYAGSPIKKIDVKSKLISVIIIDDYGDETDVPFIEFLFATINLSLTFDVYNYEYFRGDSKFKFSSNYYNQMLSGWEPCIEPCHLKIEFERDFFWDVKLSASDLIDVNLTKIFLHLVQDVKDKWCKEPSNVQIRKPFVPFALKNRSGLRLDFRVKNGIEDRIYHAENDEIVPFSFETRHIKKRHRKTLSENQLRRHQVCVKIEGWKETLPISVDRVGVYFRHANIERALQYKTYPPIRIVFDVTLEKSARKLITIRSAIQIENYLDYPVEIQFDSTVIRPPLTVNIIKREIILESQQTMSVPVQCVYAFMRLRPVIQNTSYQFCDTNFQLFSPEKSDKPPIQCKVFETYDRFSADLFQFCTEIVHEPYPLEPITQIERDEIAQPGHIIRILPNLELINCLPCEIQFGIDYNSYTNLQSFSKKTLHNININVPFEIKIKFENFKSFSTFRIEPKMTNVVGRVRYQDIKSRELILNGEVVVNENNKKVCKQIKISCSYYIENKSSLPLIFKQHGAIECAAGQFAQHEETRVLRPLLFSYLDFEGSQSIVTRIGKKYHVRNVTPQWSNQIYLKQGIQVRKLHLASENKKRTDSNYLIGIEIDQCPFNSGTQRLKITSRYEIYNKTNYALDISQTCLKNSTEQGYVVYMSVSQNSHLPFDWPCFEEEHRLVVRWTNIPDCRWSGSFSLQYSQTIGVHCNDAILQMYFIHLEVVEKGATIFLVFTECANIPPPIRVDNYSDVPLQFIQTCCKETKSTILSQPHKSVKYALSEPLEKPELTVYGPSFGIGGDNTVTYDLQKFGPAADICYQNFIYLALTATFENDNFGFSTNSVYQQLVFDVDDENNVILGRKQRGNRCLLWQLTDNNLLQYEGKRPPTYPFENSRSDTFVLDVGNLSLDRNQEMYLVVRKPSENRITTQTWHFTKEGRLKCQMSNFCVQTVKCAVGEKVFLKRCSMTKSVTDLEKITMHKMRPGSGLLKTTVFVDGPTKVLSIIDSSNSNLTIDSAIGTKENELKTDKFHLRLSIDFPNLGLSIVTHNPPLDLVYVTLTKCVIHYEIVDSKEKFVIKIDNLQCDNQLFDAQTQVVLYDLSLSNDPERLRNPPAFNMNVEVTNRCDRFLTTFKDLTVFIKPLAIYLDEALILELFDFFSNVNEMSSISDESNSFLDQRQKRYAFEKILLKPSQIGLSMNTYNQNLRPRIQQLRQKYRYGFFKFGEAFIALNAFDQRFLFDLGSSLWTKISHHFIDNLKWQLIFVLGAVNVLGNPLGLLKDVSEGVVEFLHEGNVGALVKNVAHGLSDSTAKMTETISHGLGCITMDDEYMRRRYQIYQSAQSESAKAHLSAAFQNLSNGFVDGMTGVFRMVYTGAQNEGWNGAIVGLGKGIVGAVTKPVVGMLDFTTETAKSFRALTMSKNRYVPSRIRLPRSISSSSGLLPVYSTMQSYGQYYIFKLNNHKYDEQITFFDIFQQCPKENLYVLISNQMVRIIMVDESRSSNLCLLKEISYNEIISCNRAEIKVDLEPVHYFEIRLPSNELKFRCDSLDGLNKIFHEIEYAKQMFDEKQNTLQSTSG